MAMKELIKAVGVSGEPPKPERLCGIENCKSNGGTNNCVGDGCQWISREPNWLEVIAEIQQRIEDNKLIESDEQMPEETRNTSRDENMGFMIALRLIKQSEKLSGEAKTPDTDKIWNWEGKPDWLKKLCWKLDREIWAKVEVHEATQSWGREQSAIAICQAIYENEVGKCGKSILEELTGGSVPTPCDEEIHAAARAYSLKKEHENFNLSPSERNEIITLSGFGFQDGAKWAIKEWLRSSTVGNSRNKG